ncbi:3-hydroxyacyl-CoA dehydrogenase [Desulfosporosinus orientis DSM 765]|uniref:3-hydroxybutyryl-CoA dehydrogenase n=1 Tax=Desulfosporosinus orientis (strain ATCC 19365 / DSM 765 / NCIMB 8382 / VKM B-1628 / Singapore I) TaxID=768706 RepID=G7WCJ2_DESOD|nr:3-hydroxyacyl-CoA dehydrogenase family protein [Desulfosporosinus orientis]AET66530.1 3-hydroxyacyl-CoA dehydrogenase [Desulfosporosinus orientis DSM 765]
MKVEDIKKICVIGAGSMGHQIAYCAALAGYQVSCADISLEMLQKAEEFARSYFPQQVRKGKWTQEQVGLAMSKINFTLNLEEAAKDADFVIESVLEKIGIKRELFAKLDKIAPPHAIFSTNSSFIVSSKIADATTRPDKVCNMHFFNPALMMKIVEVVQGPHTSEETAKITVDLCEKMGKKGVWLKKEIYGFVVNRFLSALYREALYLADMGVADPQEIDLALTNALGHPIGPFHLMDFTGNDLTYIIDMERYQETGDPKDKPSPLIVEKYVKGEWGRKSKKGFFDYE